MRVARRAQSMPKWILWIPVLMIAALVYWTVALGLGGLSLMAVSAFSTGEALTVTTMTTSAATDTGGGGVGAPRDGFEPILVRIEESAEPEDVDVDDNAVRGLTDESPSRAESGPSLSGSPLAGSSGSSLSGSSAADSGN